MTGPHRTAAQTFVELSEAFERLRAYAHSHHHEPAHLADAVVRDDPAVADLLRKER